MANNKMLMPLQIERQYSGSLDADYEFSTLEELKTYATTSALSYSGQILYCKGTDTIYKVNTDKTDVSEVGGEGKSAYQIWLDAGNTGSEEEFLESLKGDGADVEFDDAPTENSDNAVKSGGVFEALKGKQDCVTGGVSGQFLRKINNSEPSRFEWASHSNFVITGEVAFDEGGRIRGVTLDETYSLAKYAINKGQAVLCSLQDKNDLDTWYHLSLVRVSENKIEFEGHLRKEDSIDTVYFSMDSNENYIGKRYTTEYMPKVTGTYGQIIGFDEDGNCIAKEEGEATKPYVVKMYYTLTDNQFQAIPASRTAKWSDWYPFYEAGGEVILELHKDSVDSGDDIIRLYAHSKGIYNKTYNTLEVQFTAIGETTTYGNSDHTKYLYVCWWQSGNSCKVQRFLINEIPTGGTTGQALVKKSDTNYDVEWADLPDGTDIFVVTCNLTTVDEDNTEVQDLSATFEEIHEACINNKRVVLKAYVVEGEGAYYTLVPSTVLNEQVVFSTSLSTDRHATAGFTIFISTSGAGATFSDLDLDIVSEEIEALKKSVSDGKTLVAGAITGKGIETAADAEFATMAENIGKIESNTPLTLKHSNITNTNFINTTVCGNGVIVAFRDNLLYCSHDGGVTWKTTSLDMTNATNNCTMVYAEKHDIFIACISGMGIYTSYDGDNWTLRLSSTQANKLYYDTTTGICLAGSTVGTGSSGLWYSVNGYTWSPDSRQANKKVTYLGGAGGRLYAVIGGASHVSSDGYSWSTITAFPQYAISVIKYEQGLYMACILGVNQNQSWYYSYDGINFTQASVTFTGTTYGVGFNDIKRISTETWVVALYTGIYYTTNRGKAWSVSNLGTSTGNWAFFAYKEKFYAGSCGGPGTTYGGIQYSTDGKTWSATTGISGANFKFYCVNDRLFASCSTGVYLLNSDGISWTQIIDIGDIIYGDNDILITAGGSYSTNGIDWKDIDISNLDITSFNISKVYRCGSNLVVASTTSSNGMFYSTLLK